MSTYLSNTMREYKLINGLEIKLSIEENPFNLTLEDLFSVATRKNPKRSFLFVSRLLGKHIPVNPCIYQLGGKSLALRLLENVYSIEDTEKKREIINLLKNQESCSEKHSSILNDSFPLPEATTFIGFAETATALGQGMFDSFCGEGIYIHTTREDIPHLQEKIEFQEEHSHDTCHYIYNTQKTTFQRDRVIVLVDDELTTGKTALNIIEALQRQYPRKNYIVATILDWRSEEDQQAFEKKAQELGTTIKVVSILKGRYELCNASKDVVIDGQSLVLEREKENSISNINVSYYRLDEGFEKGLNYGDIPYLLETGRFGLNREKSKEMHEKLRNLGENLARIRRGGKTLCLGTGEFIYIPMVISAWMGSGVRFHSTTRSPIYPYRQEGYAIKNAFQFESPDILHTANYLYNIPLNHYDEVFIFFERQLEDCWLKSLLNTLKGLGIPQINIITCIGRDERPVLGSYSQEDVTFLLKELGADVQEKETKAREKEIQSGTHYSEMLPVEHKPSKEYIDLFYQSLEETGEKLACAVGVVAEKILKIRGKNLVLVSLARAGTPIGILVKRYINYHYGLDLPHYSISIIRGKGLDTNAIKYIVRHHPGKDIQFIDGWTGKGAIAAELSKACNHLQQALEVNLDSNLAVLADPGHCSSIFGSREDFLIPSACLNATVSGLISRTVHRKDLIKEGDFHGVKYYADLAHEDVSNLFLNHVSRFFPSVVDKVMNQMKTETRSTTIVTWRGLKDIGKIQKEFHLGDINFIKPGIGETTRVLLRRVPWKILIKDDSNENLKHILVLAEEKGVKVESYPTMTYQCCGLIKPLREEC